MAQPFKIKRCECPGHCGVCGGTGRLVVPYQEPTHDVIGILFRAVMAVAGITMFVVLSFNAVRAILQ